MESARKQMAKLKAAVPVIKDKISTTQECLEILRVSPEGTFEVSKGVFSRCYFLADTGYRTNEYKEQVRFLEQWSKIINTFEGSRIKISILNRKRDIEYLKKYVFYRKKPDGLDEKREAYDSILWEKIIVTKNGIEQVKVLTITVEEPDYKEACESLDTIEGTLTKDLGYITSGLIPLSGDERLFLLHNYYHPESPESFKVNITKSLLSGRDWRNDIAPLKLDFSKRDYFVIDGKYYAKTICLDASRYPSALSDEYYYNLYNQPFVSAVSCDYIPIPKLVAKKVIENKMYGIERSIENQREKRRNRNDFTSEVAYSSRRKKKEIEGMLDDINDNDQEMYWVQVSILIMAKSREELEQNEKSISKVVGTSQCYLRQREAFNTVLPIGVNQLNLSRAMFTQSACILVPFSVQEVQNTNSRFPPMYYCINMISKNAVLENRKNLINGNGYVFGVPGSGKSFFCKMDIGSVILNTEDDIIIVDPTLEYFDVADAYNGTKYNFSLDTDYYFNPLDADIERIINDTEMLIVEKSQLMQGICEHIMNGQMESVHATIIDRSIRSLYRKLKNKIIEAKERTMPVMRALYDEIALQKEEETRELLLALELFVDGSYNIFNHQTNVKKHSRLTVYGMEGLSGNKKLSGVSMIIMLETIKNKIYENFKKGKATWLYVDEIHILLNSPYSSEYLITLFKLVRKLGGICTGITQNVVDLLKDEGTATLISNSEYTVFLKQAVPDAELVLKTFIGMNRAQLSYVTAAQPGTGLIRFGSTVVPMDNRIEKNSPIYRIYNTNLHEKAAEKALNDGKAKAGYWDGQTG